MPRLLEEFELGFLDPTDLTEDQLEELVGEMAEAARSWVPLCPIYPALKGVDCDTIIAYDGDIRAHFVVCSALKLQWADRLEEMLRLDFATLKDELRYSEEFKYYEKHHRESGYLAPDAKRPHWLPKHVELEGLDPMDLWIYFAQNHYPELTKEWSEHRWEEELKAYMIIYLDDEMRKIRDSARSYDAGEQRFKCSLGLTETGGHPYMSHQVWSMRESARNIEEAHKDVASRNYWNAVKVFSRDELYDAARRMGRQLTGGLDMDLETYRRYLVNVERDWSRDWNEASYSDLAAKAHDDDRWQRYKKTTNYWFEREQMASDLGHEDVLSDTATVFVTTPRGGLEFLGIFSYANNLRKEQIPAFYESADKDYEPVLVEETDIGRMVGRTWLMGRSKPIKRVVILDDTIESGEQQHKAHLAVWDKFGPRVEIIHMAACGRRRPDKFYYNQSFYEEDGKLFSKEPQGAMGCEDDGYCPASEGQHNIFEDAILGYEQHNMDHWRILQDASEPYRRQGAAENAIPTCAFPWSISDASTAAYLRDVYGTRWERGEARRLPKSLP